VRSFTRVLVLSRQTERKAGCSQARPRLDRCRPPCFALSGIRVHNVTPCAAGGNTSASRAPSRMSQWVFTPGYVSARSNRLPAWLTNGRQRG
jgi:hypothetical protein